MGKGAVQGGVPRDEIMQIEAGMSCVAAIQEMLLHVSQGVTHLFAGAPARWTRVGFERMRTEGAFLVSARRTGGRVEPLTVESLAGGVLRLANPWQGEVAVRRGKNSERIEGTVLEIAMQKGERIRLAPGAP